MCSFPFLTESVALRVIDFNVVCRILSNHWRVCSPWVCSPWVCSPWVCSPGSAIRVFMSYLFRLLIPVNPEFAVIFGWTSSSRFFWRRESSRMLHSIWNGVRIGAHMWRLQCKNTTRSHFHWNLIADLGLVFPS